MALFLKKAALFSLIFCILFFSISYLLINNNNEAYQMLYKYQLKKIDEGGPIETIFIGDSSLGNGIDSEEFSRLSSQKTINCALTGLYGYAGPYNILKTAHERHPEIKNVIVMQTLDMQLREVSYAGYVRSADSFSDFAELSSGEKIIFLKELFYYVKSIRYDALTNRKKLIKNDYIKQGSKRKLDDIESINFPEAFDPSRINPEKNRFLSKIVAYSLDHDLNLIYINGPIHENVVSETGSYQGAISKKISETGIKFIPDMVGINERDLGDSLDHVGPGSKKEYTRKFYEIIKKHISGNMTYNR